MVLRMVSMNHSWSYVWFPWTIYDLAYGFQEPFMVLRMDSMNHSWPYVWFPRTIHGLTYGFQEPFMVLRMVSMNHSWCCVWFPRTIHGLTYGFQEPFTVVIPLHTTADITSDNKSSKQLYQFRSANTCRTSCSLYFSILRKRLEVNFLSTLGIAWKYSEKIDGNYMFSIS